MGPGNITHYAFLWMIWMKELNYAFQLSYDIKLGRVTDVPGGWPKIKNDFVNKAIKNKRS